ncbi:MAG: PQQ-binding-like beta-propeller repeat protein [Fimbriiglobus sp.]
MRAVLLGVVCVAMVAMGADWPRFRGPNGLGISEDAVPTTWDDKNNVLWKTPIPGQGNSSPIVVKGKVFLQSSTQDATARMLIRVDVATGKVDWTKSRPGTKAHTHKKNSMASSTPASDGERVYCIFWDGENVLLVAYSFDGEEVWAKTLGGYVSDHGVGMSPVVIGKTVYVNYDQDGAAKLLAFDAKTGEKRWEENRKPNRACYSSPLVRESNGQSEIINASTMSVTGYDPDTGSVKWNWVWKFDGKELRMVGSPIVIGDTLIASCGDGAGSRSTVALKLGGEQPKLLWEKKRDTPYVPCLLVKDEHVYWVTDGGFAACAEVSSGKTLWSERILTKAVSASPILVKGQIIAVAEDGKAVVFTATPKGFEKIAENTLPDTVFATPATADGKLYIRGNGHLYCIGEKK